MMLLTMRTQNAQSIQRKTIKRSNIQLIYTFTVFNLSNFSQPLMGSWGVGDTSYNGVDLQYF